MEAPKEFLARLASMFDGRVRLRWSKSRSAWHVEYKIGRAVVAPGPIDDGRDDLICARDGFLHVMAIRTGDRMPCPVCHYTLKVPVRETRDIGCPYCELKGRRTRMVVGFWPLNDSLLEHLRMLDPLRGGQEELAADADRRNVLMQESLLNTAMEPGLCAADDMFNQIAGIQSVGYTGKEVSWKVAA